jgi:hypothetical protein
MTKKNVFLMSLVYVVYFAAILLVSAICESAWCRVHDDDFLGQVLFFFLPLLPVFLLSLITYRMRDEIFQAWWSFARWFVPVIIVVTFLLENAGSGGGYLGMQKDFNFLVLFVFYSIFIITSLARIILTYRRSK